MGHELLPNGFLDHRKVKKILIWIAANTGLATLLYLLGGKEIHRVHPEMSRLAIYLNQLFMFHLLSGLSAGTAYFVSHRLKARSYWQTTLRILPFTLLACLAGIGIIVLAEILIYRPTLEEVRQSLQGDADGIMVSLYITVILTVVVSRLEFLEQERKRQHETPVAASRPDPSLKSPNALPPDGRLILRGREGQIFIPYNEILFVSSHGPVSVVHTEANEHRASMLLKEIEAGLPSAQFGRIHKSYVVNFHRISRIQYDRGGSYLAYLNDSESTILPVGRRFAGDVKSALTTSGSQLP